MSENPIEKIVRDFQDRIIRGAYQGIYRLDEKSLDHVMECQAESCAAAFAQLYQIPEDLDLDGFLERMRLGGSSKIEIKREGNTILWEELHEGQCMCPLVSRGVIRLDPGLCLCAVHWVRKLFERHVRGPVHVEMIDSAGGEESSGASSDAASSPATPRSPAPCSGSSCAPSSLRCDAGLERIGA